MVAESISFENETETAELRATLVLGVTIVTAEGEVFSLTALPQP